jgi:hypothetical protein
MSDSSPRLLERPSGRRVAVSLWRSQGRPHAGRSRHLCERPHWERCAAHDADGRRPEHEPLAREPFQASEVLHDWDAGCEQARVGRTGQSPVSSTFPKSTPTSRTPTAISRSTAAAGRNGASDPVFLRPPSRIPSRAHQDRASAQGSFLDPLERDRPLVSVRVDDDARQADDPLERQGRKILAVSEAVERRIQIGPRVAGKLDATEVELGPSAGRAKRRDRGS